MIIKKQKYKFKAYSKEYPKLYEKEKSRLIKVLPKPAIIEHVGSTSVPGLGGKGKIDIAILTPKNKLSKYMLKLERLGFEYDPNHPANDKRVFMLRVIKEKGKERRINVHLTLNKEFWGSFIVFRNYLRSHDKERGRYAKIKKEAMKHSNGEGKKYHAYKRGLIEDMQKKALKECGGAKR